MDKKKIEEFVLGLIDEIEGLGETVIWERSVSGTKDAENLERRTAKYRETIRELLKGTV